MANGFRTPRRFGRGETVNIDTGSLEQDLYQVSLATGIIDARAFGGTEDITIGPTKEQMITAAIQYAASVGATMVLVPKSMRPYAAASVVFNASVQMVDESLSSLVVNIQAYGAAGNGVQDDTPAIQAAASALVSGQTLTTPSGNYKINGEITVTASGVTLELGQATFTQIGTNKRTIILLAVSDVKVRNGKFVGKGTEHVGGSSSYNNVAAIYMSGDCTNIEISGIKATNHAGGSIRWGLGTATRFHIHGNVCIGIGSGTIVAGDNNDDVAIGSFNSTADNDCNIHDNTVLDHCFGLFLARGSGCRVHHNKIGPIPGQHGGYFSQCSDFQLDHNTVSDCAQTGLKNQISGDTLTATNLLLALNRIARCQTGIDVSVAATSTGICYFDKVLIEGNQVSDCTTNYCIATDGCRNCTVRGNDMIGNGTTGAYGLFFNNSFGLVESNLFKDLQWTAIFGALTHDTTFKNNEFVNCALNTAAAADNNRYRYFIQLNKSSGGGGTYSAPLVANPLYIEEGHIYRYASGIAEPTIFGGVNGRVVRLGTGIFSYVKEAGGRNFTTRTYLFDTTSDNKLWLRPSMSADSGNANKTVTSITEEVIIYDTAISAARTITLPAASTDNNGVRYRVVRTANCTGAFNLNINDSAAALIKALAAASAWAEVQSNGTIFRLTANGTL